MSESEPTRASRVSSTQQPRQRTWHNIFTLPGLLRQLFNQFPLATYPANTLPSNIVLSPKDNTLYIFANSSDAARGLPSLNPTCLKYQTYLRLRDIPFHTISSNNHASPSGALPFLLPSANDQTHSAPVISSSLRRWADSQSSSKVPTDTALEVHQALLDHRLRRAWLYQLYLDPANKQAVTKQYIAPASRSWVVQLATGAHLRKAAADELRKSGLGTTSEEELLGQGQEALEALEELLSRRGGKWFSGADDPGWFDAAVYAYTRPLLDSRMGWARNRLGEALLDSPGLIAHHAAISQRCGWP